VNPHTLSPVGTKSRLYFETFAGQQPFGAVGALCRMKKYTVDFIKLNFVCLTQVYISVIAAVIFMSGIGRYRLFIFLAAFFLSYAVILLRGLNPNTIKKVYPPTLIIAVYFDFTNGPILPLFPFNNLLLSFAAYFCLKWLLDAPYKKFVEDLTDQRIFTCCPKCRFESSQFSDKCNNCGYSAMSITTAEFPIGADFQNIKERISLGFFSDASISKNGSVLDFNELVITDGSLLLISQRLFQRGVSNKLEISLSDIFNVHIEERKHHGLKMNIIAFTAHESLYELFQIHKRSQEDLTGTVKLLATKIG